MNSRIATSNLFSRLSAGSKINLSPQRSFLTEKKGPTFQYNRNARAVAAFNRINGLNEWNSCTKGNYHLSPKRYLGTYLGDNRSDLITNHYETSHVPLGIKRKYGPPYTDTSKLDVKDIFMEHQKANTLSDKFAYALVRFFRVFTHLFFRDKYGHHAVVLETVAAVPGLIAGMLRHLRSLRTMSRDYGWIAKLLEEAENERMHLLTWMQVVRPTLVERMLVMLAQFVYTPCYALLYVISPKTAHRFVGYLEEEACSAYTAFLESIDSGKIPNVDAPEIAKQYWNLAPNAKLRDVVLVVRADEAMHRNVNHSFGDACAQKIQLQQ